MNRPALDARGLVRRFGSTMAVDHVDVAVEDGQLVALLGPSGCGKSTTLRLIAGLDQGEGTIDVAGVRVTGDRRPVPPERRNVGLVFQDNVLFPHLDVAANVGYSLRRGDRDATVSSMLDLLGIGHLAHRMPYEISGGEQQRTALARTLAARPALVLLDEPFAHLDAGLREQVRDDMLRALADTGSSALLVTHDQTEALAVADRIVLMRSGRVHQSDSPHVLYRKPADRFVAQFIGRASFVPVRVSGAFTAHSVFGELTVDEQTPAGDRLAVLRPESFELVAPGRGYDARVVHVSFRGGDELLRVELRDGTIVEVSDGGSHRPGDRITIVVRGEVATVADDRSVPSVVRSPNPGMPIGT